MSDRLWGVLPHASTAIAQDWDKLFYFLLFICVFFCLVVFVPMVFFAIKYRARPGHKSTYISHNSSLEIVWTIIPTVLVIIIFIWGWLVYDKIMYNPPADATEIRVVAQSWNWTFQYEDGKTTNNQLFVPAGEPVKLRITSIQEDVLHSFFVPNFRIKKDAVPGMYTTTWFEVEEPGRHVIFCAEYCGAGHSDMTATLIALDEQNWQRWQWGREVDLPPFVGFGASQAQADQSSRKGSAKEASAESEQSLVERGEELVQQGGCVACHGSEGNGQIGPPYRGIYGEKVTLANGETVVRDENYLREAIMNPQATSVKGYEDVFMPPYPGQLSEFDLNALIAYMRSLE